MSEKEKNSLAYDHRHPNYVETFKHRVTALSRIRQNPSSISALKVYYKDNPAQFISDWMVTLDPKNVEKGLPALVPFVLFPRQVEWVEEVLDHWKKGKPLLTEKTRQMGFSWLSMALSCTLCIFNEGMSIGFGSRKADLVDRTGDPVSLFHKARVMMDNLPIEFRAGWTLKEHAPYMRMLFPDTNAIITGEAGDNIGRGATTSIYFVDESAHIERPHLVEASLSQTTNCRIDISTCRGMSNVFAEKRHSGNIDVFTFNWWDDPRKDDAWLAKQEKELDPVTFAQEIMIDYAASTDGVVIPSAWVRSAVDSHIKLGVAPSGIRLGALDVADEGKDLNAYAGRHGVMINHISEWSGKGSTIYKTAETACNLAENLGQASFRFDADGLGTGVRGDVVEINKKRNKQIAAEPFRGSEAVSNPDKEDVPGRKNKDFFQNKKAQAWWSLRLRFERTHKWVVDGQQCSPDDIISIDSRLPLRNKLMSELSQPTYNINSIGKVVVDKSPEGTKSPNLADSIMMVFYNHFNQKLIIDTSFLSQFSRMGRTR